MVESSLVIPGLDDDDIAALRNTRNFAYYCDMVARLLKDECPFCDPMDPVKNPVSVTLGTWRMWPCPEKFRAKELTQHEVLAPVWDNPKTHPAHINDLSDAQMGDFESLLRTVFSKLQEGPPLELCIQSSLPIVRQIHCECIVPDGSQRVEAVFGYNLYATTKSELLMSATPVTREGRWELSKCVDVGFGIAERYTIGCLFSFVEMSPVKQFDIASVLKLIRKLVTILPGGTILMGLPGAALCMRFGPAEYNAKSQKHLHCNIKKPGISGLISETLAKDPVAVVEKMKVLVVWEKMRLFMKEFTSATEEQAMAALFPEDLAIIQARK